MGSTLRLSNNEKEFIESALREDHRIDGRRPFDSRRLSIKFSKEDGVAEVQLGQTRILGVVSAKLEAPYRDRPNEGSFAIYIEFSPMSDPTFEPGRPGEFAVEVGRIIDRGLRESKAVDTESLCVVSGRAAWAIRLDLHVLDNGGNLVDAANIAALAALLSFRRPDCSVGGPDGQEIVVHPREEREPLPLILHHIPITVTFGFFANGALGVLDPSFKEEAVMGSRLCLTVNSHGEVCAIQKGGGVGVTSSEIARCLRIASAKAADITAVLKKAAESHELERAQRKIKRHPVIAEPAKEISTGKKASGNFGGIAAQDQLDPWTSFKERGDEEPNRLGNTAEATMVDKKKEIEVSEVVRQMNRAVLKMPTVDSKGTTGSETYSPQREMEENDEETSSLQITETKPGGDASQKPKGSTELLVQNTQAQSFGLLVQESIRGSMSAAAVYANQMPQHWQKNPQSARPLGPIFPNNSDSLDMKVEPGSNDMLVESGDALSWPTVNTSALNGMGTTQEEKRKKKLKKRKKLGLCMETSHAS